MLAGDGILVEFPGVVGRVRAIFHSARHGDPVECRLVF
jgi:hypothetical protein